MNGTVIVFKSLGEAQLESFALPSPAADEVLIEAVRVAGSQTLKDMAKASGTCKPNSPSVGRSSSLSNIVDPNHIGTTVR